jgi:hypothetical protein
LKKILGSFIAILVFVSLSFADKTYIIDTPTAGILSYGSYDFGFKCFSHGNIISKIDFGVFEFLNIGLSWEFDRLIGDENIKVAIPALDVKIRPYGGNMTLPGLAIGYDGQGCFIDENSNGDYLQKEKGMYIVTGRELFLDGLMFNIGANINDFVKAKVYGFINALVPVYKESLYFMTEYDNINYFPAARLNFGLRFAVTEYINIDCIMRDCWGKNDLSRIPNERIFKISYVGKF